MYKLVGDRITVKMDSEDETTKCGLVLPSGANGPTIGWGVVQQAGPGMFAEDKWEYVPMQVKVGDRVLIQTDLRRDVVIDGERLALLSAGGVLAVKENVRAEGNGRAALPPIYQD